MDKFIELFLNDEAFGPSIERRDVPPEKLEKFRGKLPDKLLEYWQRYGWCGYAKGLFWTVDPDEWEDELEAWVGDTPFMERDSFYVIARSAFGELILWGTNTGQSLKVVPIYGGIFPAFDAEKFQRRGPDKALQLFFGSAMTRCTASCRHWRWAEAWPWIDYRSWTPTSISTSFRKSPNDRCLLTSRKR
jgi:hypothetical protein